MRVFAGKGVQSLLNLRHNRGVCNRERPLFAKEREHESRICYRNDYDDPLSMLEVGDMPKPETKPFWSTIRVKSASVNHHDVWSLQGVGLADEQTPMILGTDAAGVLQEDISVRKGLKAGSEVVLYTFIGTDGAGVMPGERRSILSERYAGTMAEYTQVPSANVFAKPENLNFDETAALGTSWLTAYSLLFTSANVKPGDTVLVQGAGGGVSTAAIQLAHAAGLEGVRYLT